jgi:peroxiredoxin
MKVLTVILFSLLCHQGFAQLQKQAFLIKGDVKAVKDKVVKVHYRYRLNGISIDDSAVVKNNQYILKGTIDEHVMLQTTAVFEDTSIKSDYTIDYHTIHITPGTKAIVQHENVFSKARVTGSAAQDEYKALHAQLVKGDIGFIPGYIQKNPNSPLAVFLLNQFIIGPFLDAERHEPYYDLLSETNKRTPAGKNLKERLEINKRTAIGKMAPDVSQKDSSGRMVNLSDFRGKYVLMEFWASWCAPCRRENPNLVKTYERFKDKNFEIFGVSIDENKKSWISAVKKDKLTWTNAADLLNEEKNPAAKAYGIRGVPHNFLIDPNGVIIGKDLKGVALEKKLEEILNSK